MTVAYQVGDTREQIKLLNIEPPDPNQMQLFDPLDRQDRMTT